MRPFALMLETACEDFSNLLSISDGEIKIVTPPRDALTHNPKLGRLIRAPARIQMAVVKSSSSTRTALTACVGKATPA